MKDKVVKSAKEIKKEKVVTLGEKFAKAKSITFADYRGLKATQITELRAKVRDAGGEMVVEKNTLIKRALLSRGIKVPNSNLEGPTTVVLAYSDEIAPIKELATSNKNVGVPTFKFGVLEKDLLDAASVENLAKIPSKEQLHANLVGSISSPIYGFVNVLSANIRNLVYVLDQLGKKVGPA